MIHYIGYITPNRLKPLHLIINKINGYIDEHNVNKYSTLVHIKKRQRPSKKLWRTMEEY